MRSARAQIRKDLKEIRERRSGVKRPARGAPKANEVFEGENMKMLNALKLLRPATAAAEE